MLSLTAPKSKWEGGVDTSRHVYCIGRVVVLAKGWLVDRWLGKVCWEWWVGAKMVDKKGGRWKLIGWKWCLKGLIWCWDALMRWWTLISREKWEILILLFAKQATACQEGNSEILLCQAGNSIAKTRQSSAKTGQLYCQAGYSLKAWVENLSAGQKKIRLVYMVGPYLSMTHSYRRFRRVTRNLLGNR